MAEAGIAAFEFEDEAAEIGSSTSNQTARR
jgi:hypothetical protein